jgi:uncharacterized membrane protein
MKLSIPFAASVVLLAVPDLIWLGLIMDEFYQANLRHLMAGNINFLAAIAFYLLYTAGLFLFAVLPAVRAGKMRRAATLGVLLGLLAYGTYDLTNQATLKDWPFIVTVVDMAWGAVLTGALSVFGFFLVRVYNKPKAPQGDNP